MDWWTLGFQAVNFLVLAWLLQRFLYRPVMSVLDRRRRESEEALAHVEAAKKAATDERTAYERKRLDLVAERDALVQETRARLERERQEVLAATRHEAEDIIAAARRALEEERKSAVAALYDKAVDLAADMAATLVNRTTTADADALLFDRLAGHLGRMAEGERAALLAQLDGAPLRVIAARALDKATAATWQRRLGDILGDGTRLAFEADETLIAGVELRFPHAALRFTWRSALDDMRAALRGS
jgi:F-type H+-transporting ATPase subunit b